MCVYVCYVAAGELDTLFFASGDSGGNDGPASPAMRLRRKSLAKYAEGANRSLILTSLDIDMREKEMVRIAYAASHTNMQRTHARGVHGIAHTTDSVPAHCTISQCSQVAHSSL